MKNRNQLLTCLEAGNQSSGTRSFRGRERSSVLPRGCLPRAAASGEQEHRILQWQKGKRTERLGKSLLKTPYPSSPARSCLGLMASWRPRLLILSHGQHLYLGGRGLFPAQHRSKSEFHTTHRWFLEHCSQCYMASTSSKVNLKFKLTQSNCWTCVDIGMLDRLTWSVPTFWGTHK